MDKEVIGYWGAGIPIDSGKILSDCGDGFVNIKWDDGREVMHKLDNIREGSWHNHNTLLYGPSPIGVYFNNLTTGERNG